MSMILEESSKRFYGIEAPSIDACTAGSSGNGNKKRHIASPCVSKKSFRNKMDNNESYTCCFIFRIAELIRRTIVPINKKSSKPKLRWTCSSLLKRGGNPKRGNSSSGRPGRGARRDPTGTSPVPTPWRKPVVLVPDHVEEEREQKIDHHCSQEKTRMRQDT